MDDSQQQSSPAFCRRFKIFRKAREDFLKSGALGDLFLWGESHPALQAISFIQPVLFMK